jgi:hypothetical protein
MEEPAPRARIKPTRPKNSIVPIVNAVADLTKESLERVVASLASKVTSRGNEHGENRDAIPAIIASRNSPLPADTDKNSCGYSTKLL